MSVLRLAAGALRLAPIVASYDRSGVSTCSRVPPTVRAVDVQRAAERFDAVDRAPADPSLERVGPAGTVIDHIKRSSGRQLP